MAQYSGGSHGGSGTPAESIRLTGAQVEQFFTPAGYANVNVEGQRIGTILARQSVTRSQARNILDSFQRITEAWESLDEMERVRSIGRLEPQLIYLAGRELNPYKKALLRDFAETVKLCITAVESAGSPDRRNRYTVVVDFIEAITAYHRLTSRI